MPVEPWAKELTESVLGGPPVQIGRRYEHPEDGEIEIISGRYWGEHGLSNFWSWRVVASGEVRGGYAGNWPEVKNNYRSTWPLSTTGWAAEDQAAEDSLPSTAKDRTGGQA